MLRRAMLAAAAAAPVEWMETVLWGGTGVGAATVSTVLDLSGGGMVWVKRRDANGVAVVYFKAFDGDVVQAFSTGNTTAATTPAATLANGHFTVPHNIAGAQYVAWAFKKGSGSGFDVARYTGSGTAGKAVPHGLGAVPEFVFTAQLSGTKINYAQFKEFAGARYARVDSTVASTPDTTIWAGIPMGPADVVLGNSALVNGAGIPAAMFAFGGSDVRSGSFVGDGASVVLDMGFSPRFLLLKRDGGANSNWCVFDATRANPSWSGLDPYLPVNAQPAESSGSLISGHPSGVTLAPGIFNTASVATLWLAIK